MDKTSVLRIAKPHYEENDLIELESAIDIATTAHANQKRKSGEKYITHPLAVAAILIDWGMDIDSVLAGVLHDTVEDTAMTLEEIENHFGHSVAFLVDGVTKVGQARAGMKDISTYLPATKDNLSKLLIAIGQDVRVIIIKLADRLHNLETLSVMGRDKQLKIARESLEVFAPMADRLGMGRVRMQIEELAFSYLEPKEFKRLRKLMKDRLGKSHRKLAVAQKEVEEMLNTQGISYTIDGRVKSVYSLYKKLQKVDGGLQDIYDLIALRIIVKNTDDCYRVLGILHHLYQPLIERIKDYIAAPKPNGYQSLHTTVITPSKQIVEFQVRSESMHEYAERGLAASFHYHEQKTEKEYRKKRGAHTLPAHLQWITQLQEIATKLKDNQEVSMHQLKVDLFEQRIFVYSPKGDIYNLPEGAFPLDFAYLVHSDIGKKAYGFKINGKIVSFDTKLRNGDIVEVLTRVSATPKRAWLDHVMTTHAKSKIRQQLKQLGIIESLTQAAAIIREKAKRRPKS